MEGRADGRTGRREEGRKNGERREEKERGRGRQGEEEEEEEEEEEGRETKGGCGNGGVWVTLFVMGANTTAKVSNISEQSGKILSCTCVNCNSSAFGSVGLEGGREGGREGRKKEKEGRRRREGEGGRGRGEEEGEAMEEDHHTYSQTTLCRALACCQMNCWECR